MDKKKTIEERIKEEKERLEEVYKKQITKYNTVLERLLINKENKDANALIDKMLDNSIIKTSVIDTNYDNNKVEILDDFEVSLYFGLIPGEPPSTITENIKLNTKDGTVKVLISSCFFCEHVYTGQINSFASRIVGEIISKRLNIPKRIILNL